MEQIIEFESVYEDAFKTPFELIKTYCICYQYDVSEFGYGPYGFDTPKAIELLSKIFGHALYWHPDQQTLIDAPIPISNGVYFFNDQPNLKKLEKTIELERKKRADQKLRKRYKPSEYVTIARSESELWSASKYEEIQPSLITQLLTKNYSFFISHSYTTDTGQTLMFFDNKTSKKIRDFADQNKIQYHQTKLRSDLKPW